MEYDSIIKSNEVLCYNMGKMKYSALVLVIFLWLLSEEVCFFLCTLERATLVTRGEECTCQCRRHGFNPWSRKIPHAGGPQLLSMCSRAQEPKLLSPHATTNEAQILWHLCSTKGEATTMRTHIWQLDHSLCSPKPEKNPSSNED